MKSQWAFKSGVVLILWLGLLPRVLGASASREPQYRSMLDKITAQYPPSVVLILADGLGYGELGCYGQSEVKTPNLDRLAAEGIRYTDFYAGSPSAVAARCSLITGRHSGHASLRGDEGHPLPQGEMTLARMLSPAEYQTTLLGSWGLGLAGTSGEPLQAGFNEVRALLDLGRASDPFPTELYRNGEAWTLSANQGGARGQYFPDLLLLMGTNFLKTAQYRPFLFIYSPTLPHSAAEPKEAAGVQSRSIQQGIYSTKNWHPTDKKRAALISRLDRDVGLLMASLEANRLFKNTYVFFTSDGGPRSASHTNASALKSTGAFRGGNGDLLEGGIRVPMIAWSPTKIPGGRVSDQPWAAWDLVPTVAELTGATKPKGIDGISMARSLHGLVQTNRHEYLYWETHEPHTRQAIRMGQWKGLRSALDAPLALYDLKTDPAEKQDVASSHPEVVAKLESYLKTARTGNSLWPLKPASQAKSATPNP